jgi:hypothetical protein
MNTIVFGDVHMFSERVISTVPIIDGVVINVYESVDVIVSILLVLGAILSIRIDRLYRLLVHLGAYHSLDLTIAEARNHRTFEFPGAIICTVSDSKGTLLQPISYNRTGSDVYIGWSPSTGRFVNLRLVSPDRIY